MSDQMIRHFVQSPAATDSSGVAPIGRVEGGYVSGRRRAGGCCHDGGAGLVDGLKTVCVAGFQVQTTEHRVLRTWTVIRNSNPAITMGALPGLIWRRGSVRQDDWKDADWMSVSRACATDFQVAANHRQRPSRGG
jgi:hypothetical protein